VYCTVSDESESGVIAQIMSIPSGRLVNVIFVKKINYCGLCSLHPPSPQVRFKSFQWKLFLNKVSIHVAC